jgi:hypothetical protein
MDVGRPRAWTGATAWRDTERLDRDLNRAARVLVDVEAVQAAIGPADRDAFIRNARRLGTAICESARPIIGLLSPA